VTAIRVLSAGAAKAVVSAIPDGSIGDGTVTVDADFGPVGAIRERVEAGEACDVVVLSRAAIDQLAAGGHVLGDTTASIGGVTTAIAVPRGQVLPDIHDVAALRSTLLAADAIHFADAQRSTAGAHFAKVLDRLGLREALASKLHEHPSGSVAMRALADGGGSAIGCTQVTEIIEVTDVLVVGPLPGEYALTTDYAGAVGSRATSPELALELLGILTGEATLEIRRAAGYEVGAG
jgi:molybdate transport system substrate-binding protein